MASRLIDSENTVPQNALRNNVGAEILRRVGDGCIVAHGTE